MQLAAVDRDDGDNAVVDYSIVRGNVEIFTIGARSGQLAVKGAVGSVGTEHLLVIQATDRGVKGF